MTYTSISLEMSVKRLTKPSATTLRVMPRVSARRQRGPPEDWLLDRVGAVTVASSLARVPSISLEPAAAGTGHGAVQLGSMARFEIVDVTDEARFGLIPPCADPSFDHRSCDYWEDADRGSKASRPGWLPSPAGSAVASTAGATAVRQRRRQPVRPAAEGRRRTPSRPPPRASANPFAPSPSAPARNPFLDDLAATASTTTRSRPSARPARPSPPRLPASCSCSAAAWRLRQLRQAAARRRRCRPPTASSGRSRRTRGRCACASCTRNSPTHRCRR